MTYFLLGFLLGALLVPTSVHNWLDASGLDLVNRIRARFKK